MFKFLKFFLFMSMIAFADGEGGAGGGGTPPNAGGGDSGGTPPNAGGGDSGGTPPNAGGGDSGGTPPNAGFVSREEFDALQKKYELLAKESEDKAAKEREAALIAEFKNDFAQMEASVDGFKSEDTMRAMLEDPRFKDEKTREAFKITYAGSNGVLRYYMENKDTIAAQGSSAGSTMDEATKAIIKKKEDGETLSNWEEAKIIKYYSNGGR